MAKILSICRTITHVNNMHTQPKQPPNKSTNPTKLTKILKLTTNTHINTFPINPTATNYHVKFSTTWKNAPINNTLPPTTLSQITLSAKYHHQHPRKYHPQQCIFTDGSFIPPTKNLEGQIVGGTVGSGVYSPNKNIHIAERLPGHQIILRAD